MDHHTDVKFVSELQEMYQVSNFFSFQSLLLTLNTTEFSQRIKA